MNVVICGRQWLGNGGEQKTPHLEYSMERDREFKISLYLTEITSISPYFHIWMSRSSTDLRMFVTHSKHENKLLSAC